MAQSGPDGPTGTNLRHREKRLFTSSEINSVLILSV